MSGRRARARRRPRRRAFEPPPKARRFPQVPRLEAFPVCDDRFMKSRPAGNGLEESGRSDRNPPRESRRTSRDSTHAALTAPLPGTPRPAPARPRRIIPAGPPARIHRRAASSKIDKGYHKHSRIISLECVRQTSARCDRSAGRRRRPRPRLRRARVAARRASAGDPSPALRGQSPAPTGCAPRSRNLTETVRRSGTRKPRKIRPSNGHEL